MMLRRGLAAGMSSWLALAWLSLALPASRASAAPPAEGETRKPTLSLARAGEYLDTSTTTWIHKRKCASCHTGFPYLLARPMLGDARAPALLEIRKFFEDRIAAWDEGGKGAGMLKGDLGAKNSEGITEVVGIAATLALHDAQSTGKLHPRTRRALDRMWALQRADGSWAWNITGLAPLESDTYFGVVYAALGVGHAPDDYARSDSARVGLTRLRDYLRKNPPPNLHHKIWLLWASLKLDGLMTPTQREQTIKDLLALQHDDGGWCLPSLGDWKRRNGKPNDPHAPSDGYATGLIVYVLRQAGVPASREPIRRGVSWLTNNQQSSGRWFTRSLNTDEKHYISDAGTAFAVMALKACEVNGSAAALLGSRLNAAAAPDTLRGLIRALQDKDEAVRAKAASELGKRGSQAAAAVPSLVEAMEDPCPNVRKAVALALGDIQGKKALGVIMKALKAEADPRVRFLLVTIVLQWGRDRGPEVKEIIPALIETMKLDYEKYTNAVESSWVALQIIGPEAVPALVALAKDTDQKVIERISALEVLDRMGKEAKEAVPALIELIQDPDDDLSSRAAYALGKLGSGDKNAIRALEAFAKRTRSIKGLIEAAEALSRSDPDNKQIVPLVLKILKEGRSSQRAHAAEVARQLGPRASATIPALIKLLKDLEESTRSEAVRALTEIAPEDKVVRAAIDRASSDPSPLVRETVKRAVKRIQYEEKRNGKR